MGIENYSTTAASNNAAVPNGAPEGWKPSDVNNWGRQVMADIRSWYQTSEWINFGDVPTQTSGTTFTIPGDVTARYLVNRRVKCADSGTLYGYISSSVFTTLTTVTLVMDSGALSASLTAVSLGAISSVAGGTASSLPNGTGNVFGQTTSVDSEMALFSGTGGKTIKRATGTGYVKVSSGVYQTPAATIPLTDLATQAADTFLANATSGAAPPTAIGLTASTLAGKGSTGNIAAISLGTNLSMSGTILNAAGVTSGTSQPTTSGTSIDFGSLPSGVKKIIIEFSGVSTSGTSVPIIQIGDSGGIEATGYLGGASGLGSGTATANFTTGFGLASDSTAASVRHGSIMLTLLDSSANTWVASGVNARSDGARTDVTAGSKSLSATLDRVRLTTVNGTDTFDAGSVNIIYQS